MNWRNSTHLVLGICLMVCPPSRADDPVYAPSDFQTSPQTLASAAWGTTTVVVLPDQSSFCTGHEDGSIILWSVSPCQPVLRMVGHQAAVTCLEIDAAGRLLSGSEDQTLRIWETTLGQCLFVLDGPTSWLTSCAVSQDGRWAAAGGYDCRLCLWRLDQPEEDPVVFDHQGACVQAVVFSNDGKLMASGARDGFVRLWSITEQGALPPTLFDDTSRGSAEALAFTHDDSQLLIGYEAGIVSMCPVVRNESGATLGDELPLDCSHSVTAIEVLSDDAMFAAATADGEICVARLAADSQSQVSRVVLTGHVGLVADVALLSTDAGPAILSVGEDRTIQLWRTKLPATLPIAAVESTDARLWAVALSPSAGRFAVGGRDGYLAIHDLRTGELLHEVEGFEETVDSLSFSSDGRLLVVSSWKAPLVRLIDVESGALQQTIDIAANGRQVHFLPDDQGVLVACDDLTLQRIGFEGEHRAVNVSDLPTYSVDVSPDGDLVAVGSGDWQRQVPGTLKLYRSSDLTELTALVGHEHAIRWVAFHPAGRLLASADESGLVIIWNIETRAILHRLINPAGCKPVAFSPDGAALAVGLKDGSIQVWDWQSNNLLQRMSTESAIFDLVFSADGTAIIAVNGERRFFVWPLAGQENSGTALDASGWTPPQESAQ